jgi:hypothetical protein
MVVVAGEGAAAGARIGREIGGIAGGLIGAGLAWARKGETDPTQEEMRELYRQGDALLGRTHSEAARKRWQDWFNDLSKREKDLYAQGKGPRPRKRN